MMHITIFANGDMPPSQTARPIEGMVLAADGGAKHCLRLGITPQVVIGDFDSLTRDEIRKLEADGAEFRNHPADKDQTDLELALDFALEQGAENITLYGLLGGRWDMSLANLLLLASPRYGSMHFHVIAGHTEAFMMRGGQSLEINGQAGDTLSVIPLDSGVRGLTYEGLHWPLENATLPLGSPRGVSNVLDAQTARIGLEKGLLLVILIRKT